MSFFGNIPSHWKSGTVASIDAVYALESTIGYPFFLMSKNGTVKYLVTRRNALDVFKRELARDLESGRTYIWYK